MMADRFEELTNELFSKLAASEKFTIVEGPRVLLQSPDGEREFDLVIRAKVAGLDLLTVVECRDYKKNLDVTNVDGFYSKMQDVNASKGVLVARKGFSNTAIQKARRLGIDLFVAHDLKNNSDVLQQLALQIPITFVKIGKIDFNVKYNVDIKEAPKSFDKDAWAVIDGVDIRPKFKEYLFETDSLHREAEGIWVPQIISKTSTISAVDGTKVPITDFEAQYKLHEIEYFFGYVGIESFPSTIGLKGVNTSDHRVYLDIDDVRKPEVFDQLTKYSSLGDVPSIHGAMIVGLEFPDVTDKTGIYDLNIRRLG